MRTSCSDRRCVIQGVHELYDSHVTTPWQPEETPTNIIVFIGNMIVYDFFFSVRLLSVLRGHSVFSSPPQRPMNPDFEECSIPDLINYIYFPILILEKEPVFPFLMFSAKQGNYLVPM